MLTAPGFLKTVEFKMSPSPTPVKALTTEESNSMQAELERSRRCVIHFPRRRLGFPEFFGRRWVDRAVRSLLRCVLFLLLGLNSLWAVDPSRHISQYAHTAWRIQDGVFSGRPTVISQ